MYLSTDEVNALVLDIGASTTKAGYAGADSPAACFSSNVGYTFTNATQSADTVGNGPKGMDESADTEISPERRKFFVDSMNYYRDSCHTTNPLKGGLVNDWEVVEQLWSHALRERLRVDCKEHPVLMSEASWNTRTLREMATEIMFEKYQVPAFFVAKSAVLTGFASGKSTGLVLESGASCTSAVPVHDGYALSKNIFKTELAGNALDAEIAAALAKKQIPVNPHYCLKKKETPVGSNLFKTTVVDMPLATQSYRELMVKEVARDMKESVFKVSEIAFVVEDNLTIPTVPYEFPDGTSIEVGTDRFTYPEALFEPQILANSGMYSDSPCGVHQMVHKSISSCDTDLRKELYNSIIVTGGTTLLPGFVDRFNRELTELSPTTKLKFIASNSAIERKYSVWIGGSILGSLGSFQQMWVSKSEYEEHGKSLIERKCP